MKDFKPLDPNKPEDWIELDPGFDIHRKTAAEIFHCAEKDVTPEQRKAAKLVNFRHLYGTTKWGSES